MKSQWQTKTLGDVATLQRGLDLPTANRVSGRFPLVSSSGISDRVHKSAVTGPGVVTGRSGSIGNVFFIDADFWPLNTVLYVKNFHGNSPRFIFHLLNHFDLKRFANGTGVPTLNRNFVHNEKVGVPPLPEQQRIVAILDEAFEAIATAKANAEKNLQNARDLFESRLQEVFSSRQQLVVRIGDIAEVFDGPHATPKTVDEGPIFLGISALQNGEINLGETRHVTLQDFQQWTRRVKPHANDIVFSYETRLGQAAIIPEGLECCLGRRMALIRVDRQRANPKFILYQYISPIFRNYLSTRTVRGATVDRISLRDFPDFPMVLPPIAEQDSVVERLDDFRKEARHLESIFQRKIAALDELKKSLLHQAFSGAL